jgi:hypothetical protein
MRCDVPVDLKTWHNTKHGGNRETTECIATLVGKVQLKRHLERLGIDGRIILK